MIEAARAGQGRAGDVVEQAAKPVRLLARVGLVAYGLVYLVVAALIVQVAFGDHERADKKGALQEIAESGTGRLLLWVVVAGLAALVVLRLVDAVSAYRRFDGRRRVGRMAVAVGEAVVYAVLARSAATIAQAEGGDSFSKSVVAALFGLPGGPFLVGLVGVALVAAGGYAVVHGVRRDFLRDLALPPRFRTLVTVLGTVGWTALGVAGGRRAGCWSRPPCSSTPRLPSASTPGSGHWPISRSDRSCCSCWPPGWRSSPSSACSTRGTARREVVRRVGGPGDRGAGW